MPKSFPQKVTSETPSTSAELVKNILKSEEVAATLDRINLSNRKFTLLASSIVKASTKDSISNKKIKLSVSTVRRNRKVLRNNLNLKIKETFLGIEKPQMIVHWDGKQMKDSTNKDVSLQKRMVERLPIIVTGNEVEKLLAVPILHDKY